MIRFPPTSIALSQSDIDFHLREIQIKEHLYAQGFTKKEVHRYYSERHGSVNGFDADDDGGVLSTRTSSVNLQTGREKQALDAKAPVLKRESRRPSGTSERDLDKYLV
jgi:hypothetical protein